MTSRATPIPSDGHRLALLGVFGVGNFGNEATLDVVLGNLGKRFPRDGVWCICSRPDVVRSERNLPSFPLGPTVPLRHKFNRNAFTRGLKFLAIEIPFQIFTTVRMLATVFRLQALVIPGTGVLDDFGMRPMQLPFDLLRWCALARLARRPVLILGAGAGPIRRPVSRWMMKTATRLATYRSFRDEASRDYMATLGVSTARDKVVPDLVFATPHPHPAVRSPSPDGCLRVAIGVMAFWGWENDPATGESAYRSYLNKLTTFVLDLLHMGHFVRLIVGDRADDRPARELFQAVHHAAPETAAQRLVTRPQDDFAAVLDEIAQSDLVIATRYHNVVAAAMLARPLIAIGYGTKSAALMTRLGLESFCQPIETLDLDVLRDQFARLVTERAPIRDRLETSAAALREAADEEIARGLTRAFSS